MRLFVASIFSFAVVFSAASLVRADFITNAGVVNRGTVYDPSGTAVGGSGYITAGNGSESLSASYVHLSQLSMTYTPSSGSAQTLYTYCVDMFTSLQTNFSVTPTSMSNYFTNQKNATEIAYLYLTYGTTSHYVNTASNPSFSAWGHDFALQMAIWDLSLNHTIDPKNPFSSSNPNDPSSPYFNVNTPANAAHGNAAANSYIQGYMSDYLTEAQNFANSGGTVVGVEVLQGSGSQSVLYAENGAHVQNVPEPSAKVLLGLGSLCGLTWIGLKRRQQLLGM